MRVILGPGSKKHAKAAKKEVGQDALELGVPDDGPFGCPATHVHLIHLPTEQLLQGLQRALAASWGWEPRFEGDEFTLDCGDATELHMATCELILRLKQGDL